ncbi:DUF6427 family protein [Changchengzhania lutea]|uniref:DUF6427 family protein n=1 Tax=Changchengzhania lutea TaxID=2049305 RepID=UPI00115DFD03|nr:DUF6427 family protein [Changchengzhania lutea]
MAFVIGRFNLGINGVTILFVFKQMALFGLCYLSVLLLNFIVGKNELTKKSNYEMLLYSLFLLVIVQVTTNNYIIISNFFVLLGIRRMISLRSQIDVKKKLFDAAFWIALATLFYFWSILFFVLIIVSLFLYTDNKVNHWVIPFTGILCVFVIGVAISIIWYDGFFEVFRSLPQWSFNFSTYNTTQFIIAITLLFSFGIWSSLFYIKNIKQKKKGLRPSYYIILIAAFLAFILMILAPEKNGSEFLFLLGPLAIIITNYIESIDDKWFKEFFLAVLIIVPFVLLML